MPPRSFKTSDIALVAYLKSKGYKIQSLDRSNKEGKCTFVFEPNPEIDKIVLKFFNGQCTVEPMDFLEQTRRVKALIYGEP
ncbi:MAG: DUF5659 domain-containing protein [Candidatus Zixiibacteriota bacterium]